MYFEDLTSIQEVEAMLHNKLLNEFKMGLWFSHSLPSGNLYVLFP